MLALASQAVRDRPALRRRLLFVGIFGTAIFFGDGVITPAISVLGAVEGLQVAAPGLHTWVVPITLVVLSGALHVPAPRHGARRQAVRAGDGRLVRRHRHPRPDAHRRQPGDPEVADAALRAAVPVHPSGDRLHRPRLGRALRHRRRGALRRHGPLRQAADPARVVRHGDAGADAQLLRPGRDAARRPEQGRQSVLPDGAAVGALSAHRPGDVRGGDRLAGADHGGVLGRQAGDPARLPAAPAHPAHLRQGDRPDLRALRQLGPVRRHRHRRRPVRLERRARRRLRHHGDDRHADHDDDDLLRRPLRAGSTPGGWRRWRPASSSSSTSPSSPPTSSR